MQHGISGIGQIAINAKNVERATAFYRDIVGLPLLMQVSGMAFFDCAGVRLMLSPPESGEHDHLSSILYFKVADIRAVHGQLAAKGVHFEREPHMLVRMPDHDLWMAFFRDSENNVMALMSEVMHAGTPATD